MHYSAMTTPLGSLFQWPSTHSVKNLFLMSSLNSTGTASFLFLVSCRWSPERDQHLPLRCSPWGRCRLQWSCPSAFSSPSWTNQATLATPHKTCLWDLSPSWSPSSGHTPLVWWCPYIEVPKTTHSTRGGATPDKSKHYPISVCIVHSSSVVSRNNKLYH